MKATGYRTTFSLDEVTSHRLRRLAAAWRVSRAEVVRRAVAMAEAGAGQAGSPREMLQRLHADGGGVAREAAERYLAEVRTARTEWRREP